MLDVGAAGCAGCGATTGSSPRLAELLEDIGKARAASSPPEAVAEEIAQVDILEMEPAGRATPPAGAPLGISGTGAAGPHFVEGTAVAVVEFAFLRIIQDVEGGLDLLEALFGVLAPDRMADPHIKAPHRTPGIRDVSHHDLSERGGVVFFTLENGLPADDELRVLRHQVETLKDADFPALPPDQVAFISDHWGDDPGVAFVDPRRYFAWSAGQDSDPGPGE